MITAPNTSATGTSFTKAPNGSAFRKVFLNNMDENSFRKNNYGFQNQIELMISNRLRKGKIDQVGVGSKLR